MQFWSLFRTKEFLGAVVIVALFLLAGYFSHKYEEVLVTLIAGEDVFGLLVYMGLLVVATVFAPVAALPLMPVAVTLWGPLISAGATILAWIVGGTMAFALAKSYGRDLVGKFVNMESALRYGSLVTGENPFWAVLILRILTPVDLLSYAVGLFVNISYPSYILATAIGVTPFAFVFAFASELSVMAQVVVFGVAAIVIGIGLSTFFRRVQRSKAKTEK